MMNLLLKSFEEISKLEEDIINDLYNVTQIEIKEREPLKRMQNNLGNDSRCWFTQLLK